MGCPAFWDDLRFNLQPEINMYNSKKIKIMDALFWIYIISVVAVALMGDFKEMAEDKSAPSQEKCDTTLCDLRRERARMESRMVEGELFK